MTMPTKLRERVRFSLRSPAGAALSAAVLALLAFTGWHGARALRFHRDEAAAREALARYDFPEARRRLASCLGLRPADPEALLLAAQAARRDGQLDEAQDYLDRQWQQAGRSTPEAALQGTLVQVQRGLVKEHVRELLEYLEIRHTDSEQILEALAQGCVRVYRLDEALFWTKQLRDRFPANPVGRLIDAQTNETLLRTERALEIARRLVEDYPDNDKARLYLAELLARGRQYEEAADHYRELHRRQPAALAPLLGLVRALLSLERLDEAAPLLRELAEAHADNADALLERGRFALARKRPADAEPLLRRAADLAPNDADVHRALAVCLGQLGGAEESRRHLERSQQIEADLMRLEKAVTAMSQKPNDPGPRREAGAICLRNGQVAEGLRWLDGALEVAPDDKPTHQLLADFYASQGDAGRARFHQDKAR
jgi:tetratricopeptide (TPR) repeat protein